jgi:hypothetical protein
MMPSTPVGYSLKQTVAARALLAFSLGTVAPLIATAQIGANAQQAAVVQQPQTFIERYQARVTETQNEQPHWITPLVTVTPRLEQELRTDFVHQYNSKGFAVWNYGNSKGLGLWCSA